MVGAGAGGPAGPAEAAGHAHVFVADVESPEIDEADRHHLERVLRIGADQAVTVADGTGRWRMGHLVAGRLEPAGEVALDERPQPLVTVAFAPTKGDRPEWAVQKLTELGVDHIVVFMAARSVVRWSGDRGQAAVGRLAKVAREAAMQSRRSWLPSVELVPSLAAVAEGRKGVALADMVGEPPSLDRPTLLIGPEGGWDHSERAGGLPLVSLGSQVLRAETATVVAATLLCALRSGLVTPAGPPSDHQRGPSA